MCGRYYVDDDTAKEIERLVKKMDQRFESAKRDIYPNQSAPILYEKQDEIYVTDMDWGFPSNRGKGVIFNARSETAMQKTIFKDSMLSRRCIIPAAGFYEWDKAKNKVRFESHENKIVYMAGIWRMYGFESRFVILTTKANESVQNIHDRMPLILEENEVENWICDNNTDGFVNYVINKIPKNLKVIKEYEQIEFDFNKLL